MHCGKIFSGFALLCMAVLSLQAGDIQVGLFYGGDIQAVVFSTVEGEYMLSGNGRQIAVIRKGTMFHIERSGSQLIVHDTLQSYGVFHTLELKGTSKMNVFQVRSVFPSLPAKESDDDLSITVFNDAIQLINRLSLEKYVSGVVDTEGGISQPPEYYKAQAVLVRTYAVKNFHRHAPEGFNLCDGVHCQAFNGKSRMNTQIYESTLATNNEILVDSKGEPIVAAYHANCGGVTGDAASEWNRELSYLVPVQDPFCSKSGHTYWSHRLSQAAWKAYLESKGYWGDANNLYSTSERGRHKYLDRENSKLPLTEIRSDLKLKSTYFYVESERDEVIIHGHGFGHGLGMCQEGAMEMAHVGYTYVDILMFYFRNVKIEIWKEAQEKIRK